MALPGRDATSKIKLARYQAALLRRDLSSAAASGSIRVMELKALVRTKMKAARKSGMLWVRLLDLARRVATAEGRGVIWTLIVHNGEVHQTTAYTCEERYPKLFDLAAALAPNASRILSFGCSTGEELVALRRRFSGAEIFGAEINRRSRQLAARRLTNDMRMTVVEPQNVAGTFDLVFALSVFQREPHKVEEMAVQDLTAHYPFERFDRAVNELGRRVRANGLFCLMNAQYRFEDSSIFYLFDVIQSSPQMEHPFFGRDGRRLGHISAHTVFRKRY